MDEKIQMSEPLRILRRLWEIPPREAARKARKRIFGPGTEFDALEILRSDKLMRGQRFYDFLSRYESILERTVGWKRLEFEGKRVLEIGCGPMMAYGPIAAIRGAASYSAVEPKFDPQILHNKAILEGYYLSVFKDLSAIYGENGDFEQFMDFLRNKAEVHNQPFHEAPLEGPFDTVVSISCLEHVFPPEETIKALHRHCHEETRFVHLVNFANHRPTYNPFDGLYELDPDDYMEKYGMAINLWRSSDVFEAFEKVGFDVGMVPYQSFKETYNGTINEYWRQKYSDETLFMKTAIFYGPK
jgi:SAM-dependent methyltransferase